MPGIKAGQYDPHTTLLTCTPQICLRAEAVLIYPLLTIYLVYKLSISSLVLTRHLGFRQVVWQRDLTKHIPFSGIKSFLWLQITLKWGKNALQQELAEEREGQMLYSLVAAAVSEPLSLFILQLLDKLLNVPVLSGSLHSWQSCVPFMASLIN